MIKKIRALSILSAIIIFILTSCTQVPESGFSDTSDPEIYASATGLKLLLIACYGELDGWAGWIEDSPSESTGTNWVFGEVMADNAYTGGRRGENEAIRELETYTFTPTNTYIASRWNQLYQGIFRCNELLRMAEIASDRGLVDNALAQQYTAEALFLRAFFHFEAARLWDNIPFIDEASLEGTVPNNGTPWAEIKADLDSAKQHLPLEYEPGQEGRASKMAAMALLGKVLLYEKRFVEAESMFEQVINSSMFDLEPEYSQNFRLIGNYNRESVFEFRSSYSKNLLSTNSQCPSPYIPGSPIGCGYFQPSQDLVNAFRIEEGLPIPSSTILPEFTSDQGVSSNEPFTPYSGEIDPRLDWTVGRRGIPYLDWGVHRGMDWIVDQTYSGPYSPIKNIYTQQERNSGGEIGGWGGGLTFINHKVIRYADVLLMLAECEVQQGNSARASYHLVMVRHRASHSLAPYTSAEVLENIMLERRLELALEGHRWFDLKRWGILEQTMNDYFARESTNREYLSDAKVLPHHIRLPIPQSAIDQSGGVLLQNPGY